MRKVLSFCLTLTLLLGLVPGAAAAETGAFASLGPYHTWSETEKKTAFDTWSEEEWTLYWDAYGAAAGESGQYDQYWQDYLFASEEDRARFWNDFERLGPYGGWTEAEKEDAFSHWSEVRWGCYWGSYYESFDWPDTSGYDADESAYWEDVERRAVREENRNEGLPYPEGNVNWNGTWLTFGETAPVARSGRLMVPFRAFLEGRGAQVAYEDGHIGARLPDGALIEMDLGETAVTVTRNDRIDTLEMDVTPYAAGGRVYLPVRFAAQALGAEVYWDEYGNNVYLLDRTALTGELDRGFTHMNALLAGALAAVEPEQNYDARGNIALSAALYRGDGRDTAAVRLDLEGRVRGDGSQMDLRARLGLDLEDFRDSLLSEAPETFWPTVETLDGSTYDLRFDAGAGSLYLRGNRLSELSGGALPSDTWIGGDLGVSIPVSPQSAPTVGQFLTARAARAAAQSFGDWERFYDLLREHERYAALMVGDGRFAVRSSGGDTVYTLEIDGDTLAGLEPPLWSGIEGLEGALEDERETDFDASLTARLSAEGVLEECRLNGRAALGPLLPGELTCSLEGTGLELTGELALNGCYLGRLECSFAGRMVPTEEPVRTAPGPGEKQAGFELFTQTAQ